MTNSLRPTHPPVFRPCRNLLAVCFAWTAAFALGGCDSSGPSEPTQTSFTVSFTRSDTVVHPDSIYWRFAGASGATAFPTELKVNVDVYKVPISVAKNVPQDTVFLSLVTLSVATAQVKILGGLEVKDDLFLKHLDFIANRLLVGYKALSKQDPSKNPWTRLGVHARYAALLFAGDSLYKGYPKNCPSGINTALVDSLILNKALSSKESVDKYAPTWLLNWTGAQVEAEFRRWLEKGVIRMGQYDTLYPLDDLPPTVVSPLRFAVGADSTVTTLVRKSSGVKLCGTFGDDSGIVGQMIRIWFFPPNADSVNATSKFILDTVPLPSTPQKSWSLADHFSIKTDSAILGLYRLELSFQDRKNQMLVAKYPFSVSELAILPVDSTAPQITRILPANQNDTVDDTTTSKRVRLGVSDENLKTVVLDQDTVHPLGGVVEKTVSLVEGKSVCVRILAVDTAGNSAKDSVILFRRVAVPPTLVRVQPQTGRDSVLDTTTTYSFRWQVQGIDVDSVTIDSFGILLDQKVAEKTLPLQLGGLTRVQIRVVDKLRHVVIDSADVMRSASIPPTLSRVGIPGGVVTVPDTQSFFTASWAVADNNLQTVSVLGKEVGLTNGQCGATVFLKAGDTAKIPVWAKDKLGSVATDTVKVWRPDPRTPYLADILAAQRGDAAIALTDYVLPNIRFGRFEVTTGLYATVMKTVNLETSGKPVANVNIYEAMLFCNALSKSLGLDTFYTYTSWDAANGFLVGYAIRSDTVTGSVLRKGFRLPTAAEWDVAATFWGASHPRGNAEDTAIINQYAVWKSASASLVGSRQPTGGGMFDLAGNVEEWISQNRGHPKTGPTLAVAWGQGFEHDSRKLGRCQFLADRTKSFGNNWVSRGPHWTERRR